MTILVGTASWADKSLVDSGKFYPSDVTSPEARLRYYASQFPIPDLRPARLFVALQSGFQHQPCASHPQLAPRLGARLPAPGRNHRVTIDPSRAGGVGLLIASRWRDSHSTAK